MGVFTLSTLRPWRFPSQNANVAAATIATTGPITAPAIQTWDCDDDIWDGSLIAVPFGVAGRLDSDAVGMTNVDKADTRAVVTGISRYALYTLQSAPTQLILVQLARSNGYVA